VNELQYPDAELAVKTWARANATLQTVFGTPARFTLGTPRNQSPTFPLSTLARVGGAPDPGDVALDRPAISFSVWGDNRGQAAQAAMVLVRAVSEVRCGTAAGASAVLLGADVTMGPLWSPDPDDDRARYIVDATFRLRVASLAA
jgi:hypothetical protein